MQEYDRLVCERTEGAVDARYHIGDTTRGELIRFGRLKSHLEEYDLPGKEENIVVSAWVEDEIREIVTFP